MITTDRISQREEWVVASLLDNLVVPWGPNIMTALSFVDYWNNPVPRIIARSICGCMYTNLTRANIARGLGPEESKWLSHPTFYENGLPLDLAEYEAHDLCIYYRTRRLERLLGDSWTRIKDHPEQSKCVAQGLALALQEYT